MRKLEGVNKGRHLKKTLNEMTKDGQIPYQNIENYR